MVLGTRWLALSTMHNHNIKGRRPKYPRIARHFRHAVTDFTTFSFPTRALKPLLYHLTEVKRIEIQSTLIPFPTQPPCERTLTGRGTSCTLTVRAAG